MIRQPSPFRRGIDQGETQSGHSCVTQTFIADHFEKNGNVDLGKVQLFLSQLRNRRSELVSDAKETAIIERVQRDVWPLRKARDEGARIVNGSLNPALRTMDLFLLPRLEKILTMVESCEHNQDNIKAELHDFMRGYAPFYVPNQIKTQWTGDNEFFPTIKKIFRAHRIPIKSDKAVEASNLVVEGFNINAVNAILSEHMGHTKEINRYLTPDEITTLKQNGFDLSILNHGVSAFHEPTTYREVEAKRIECLPQFPTDDEKLTYTAPRYRSAFSVKFTAAFERNNKKIKLKVKLGPEVHPDLIASQIRAYMGFHQDTMLYREKIKIWLGPHSYDRFERDIAIKYGLPRFRQCIAERGKDDKTGEVWVVFKDGLLELRPETEIRATIMDLGIYDNSNRRELRSRHLLNAFLASGDALPRNHRMVLVKTEQGDWLPQYRLQDLGRSLGLNSMLQRPRDILRFPKLVNKINEYSRPFVWRKGKNTLVLSHADTFRHSRDDMHATYADLKWMARRIGSLPDQAIQKSIELGGIPEELQKLYFFQITSMKNQVIETFQLADSSNDNLAPPILPTPLPKQKDLPDTRAVCEGEIVTNYFKDKIILPRMQETWFTFLSRVLSGPAQSQAFTHEVEQSLGATYSAHTGAPITANQKINASILERQFQPGEPAASLSKWLLEPGIAVEVSRVVIPNYKALFASEGQGRPYIVADRLFFSIGVNSPAFLKLLNLFGLNAAVKLKVFRCGIEHIRYSETVSEGYKKRPLIARAATKGLEAFALNTLEPGEGLRTHWSAGLDAAAHTGLKMPMPFTGMNPISNYATMKLAYINSHIQTYTRDTYGALHLITEQNHQRHGEAGAALLKTDVIQTSGALLAASLRSTTSYTKLWNIEYQPRQRNIETASRSGLPIQSALEVDTLTAALKKLRSHPESIKVNDSERPEPLQLRYQVDARKKTKSTSLQGAFVFNHAKLQSKTDFHVTTQEHEYNFIRYTREKKGTTGFENALFDFSTRNVMLRDGHVKRLSVEMDRENPNHFVVIIELYDYLKKSDSQGVEALLHQLNRRYSERADKPFFRESLPPTDQPYRRIYAHGRIYINGSKLLELFDEKEIDEFLSKAKTLYRNAPNIDTQHLSATERTKQFLWNKQLRNAVHAYTDSRERVKLDSDQDLDERERHAAQEALAKSALELINVLYKSKFGVTPLKSLLGDDSLFVVGEVFGIHQQTNFLHDDMWKNVLRFAGSSWGSMTRVPPISHFIRYHQPGDANPLMEPQMRQETFIGRRVTGLSGDYQLLGQR